jgi:hypothetical protein
MTISTSCYLFKKYELFFDETPEIKYALQPKVPFCWVDNQWFSGSGW